MQEQTITALCAALTAQQLPFAQGEPLAPHTTFKIGGPAAFWCTPRDAEQLRRTLQLCRENGVRVYLLGNGSNTLFDDAGFDGAVIDMRGLSGMENSGLDTDAVRITAGAGQTLGRLCSKAQTLGLTGLEFACGIPGTVGGAVYMNAGAYGSELKDVLESVTFLDSDLQLRTLPAADLAMGYRTSIFEQNPDWCILSATVVLHRYEYMLEYALPLYVKEGKSQLMIAVGCTGGKHRSITFARKIGEFCKKLGYAPSVQHRDVNRSL